MNKLKPIFATTSTLVFVLSWDIYATQAQNNRADLRNEGNILIAQSRTEYVCQGIGGVNVTPHVEPDIPGTLFRNTMCYVPVSAGKCVLESSSVTNNPSGMTKCNAKIITDEATGEEYYEFSSFEWAGARFVLEN